MTNVRVEVAALKAIFMLMNGIGFSRLGGRALGSSRVCSSGWCGSRSDGFENRCYVVGASAIRIIGRVE